MIGPFILFVASGIGICAAFLLPGMTDLLLLAVPCAVASLYLLIRAVIRQEFPPNWIVIDGSNVMHWKDGTPQIDTLREVVQRLTALGFTPGVVFDANAGYKISGRYRHDWAFGKLLGLPEDRIMVVAKGTPADAKVLEAARGLGARVVTNDRYRDWADDHPEVLKPGYLIRGGYRDGALWLDVG
ncbi:MAG: hypothetical protein ABIV25_01845 [Paracoccaceae bacterium]